MKLVDGADKVRYKSAVEAFRLTKNNGEIKYLGAASSAKPAIFELTRERS
ncbi:hypothetical protein NQ038_12720 [Brevibacterium sp. 50QC2O2]|nr:MULTISPECIES: hypothetical protein [unclassified Brevibacterium]MCQ9368669.1 hypothetical protein [Brevibacterium sp. 91QC2O2]MCQ9389502.1 hypothetical protein [Brevibacterium sp. 50QC2O2]